MFRHPTGQTMPPPSDADHAYADPLDYRTRDRPPQTTRKANCPLPSRAARGLQCTPLPTAKALHHRGKGELGSAGEDYSRCCGRYSRRALPLPAGLLAAFQVAVAPAALVFAARCRNSPARSIPPAVSARHTVRAAEQLVTEHCWTPHRSLWTGTDSRCRALRRAARRRSRRLHLPLP